MLQLRKLFLVHCRGWPASRRLLCAAGLLGAAAVAAWLGHVFIGANTHTVIERAVYRSAQLNGDSLARLIERHHIRTVVNLRGFCPGMAWYREEAAAIAAAGVSQEDITLSANRLPPPGELTRLIEVLDRSEYPLLLHCKQGADRTGLASAVVLLLKTNATLPRARRELWPHRGHFPVARTVAMDDFLDRYEAWLHKQGEAHTPSRFRAWVARHYSPGPAVAQLAWLTPVPESIPAQQPFALKLRATNQSAEAWEFQPGATAGIQLQYQLYSADNTPFYSDRAGLFRRTVPPGDSIDLMLAFPALPPGRYLLRAELADFRGAGLPVRAAYFFQFGSDALMAELHVH